MVGGNNAQYIGSEIILCCDGGKATLIINRVLKVISPGNNIAIITYLSPEP